RASYRPQCQRSRRDHHPRDTGHLFLCSRPARGSMGDPGWAHAFRGRAAFEHDQVRGITQLAWRMRVTRSIHLGDVIATRMPEERAGVRVVRRHHLLVRYSHWLNVPVLLGLIMSGVSIYWASPIYQHKPDPFTGSVDFLADVGTWTCAHVPGLHR